MRKYVKSYIHLTGALLLVAIFVLPYVFSVGTVFAAQGIFAVDGDHLYGDMSSACEKDGACTLDENNHRILIPWVYQPESASPEGNAYNICGDSIKITVEFEAAAKENMQQLSYSVDAEKMPGKEDVNAAAYLLDFAVQLNSELTDAAYTAKVTLCAKADNGIDQKEVIEERQIKVEVKGNKVKETETKIETEPLQTCETMDETDDETMDETDDETVDETVDETKDLDNGGDPPIPGGNGDDFGGGGSDSTPPPTPAPKIIIKSCITTPEEIHPGDKVDIKLIIKNNSKTSAIDDLRINYESAAGELLPVEKSNSIYINHIPIGGEAEVSFAMQAAYTITAVSQKIILTMDYVDKEAANQTITENIFLRIKQPFSVTIDQPVMASKVESGSSQEITLDIFNTGKTQVKNVMCTLEMDGVLSSGTVFSGDVAAGESAKAVFKTVIAYKNFNQTEGTAETKNTADDKTSESKDSKYGKADGVIRISYEDESGKNYTEERMLSTIITAPAGQADDSKPVEKSSQWWISIVVGLIVIELLSAAAFLIYKRRNVR